MSVKKFTLKRVWEGETMCCGRKKYYWAVFVRDGWYKRFRTKWEANKCLKDLLKQPPNGD